MAYFTFAAQAVGNLQVQIHSPYLRLDTVKIFLKGRADVWTSLREIINAIDEECRGLRNSVFIGGAISRRSKGYTFLRNIPRGVREIRRMTTSVIPDVYAIISSGDKKMRAGAIAMSHLLSSIQ